MGTLSKIQYRKQMNYKKETCPNCKKEFRKVIDSNWVIFCGDKCANEYERNRKTSGKNGGYLRNAS